MTMDDKLARLTAAVAEISGLDHVERDTNLAELGVDSMKVVEIIVTCEQIYSGASGFEDLRIDQFTTINSLHEQFVALMGTSSGEAC
jgi:acyl carrier protein